MRDRTRTIRSVNALEESTDDQFFCLATVEQAASLLHLLTERGRFLIENIDIHGKITGLNTPGESSDSLSMQMEDRIFSLVRNTGELLYRSPISL